jgi:hypothetical protein
MVELTAGVYRPALLSSERWIGAIGHVRTSKGARIF